MPSVLARGNEFILAIYIRVYGHAQECGDFTLKNASNCATTAHLYTCHIVELEDGRVSESEEDSVNEGREDSASATGSSGLDECRVYIRTTDIHSM